ncbi:phosphate/phosphite/phosphonate ABC transporter substrate-binding protein [Salinicoccus kekensis]|uniref:Phosphonate transport system substrate-binding protein n=1 Tax=Salinicoccus kekensis TaxID=714307 RepID=A0A285UB22_9STAP|nr:phosphate/phosphite/phosphonate ABC transporter substrate-binding protein [Salinicoccus kekensis]SOC38618.1 phosphonate transport system substrate-binding protein [Salinicoccus kekensis]
MRRISLLLMGALFAVVLGACSAQSEAGDTVDASDGAGEARGDDWPESLKFAVAGIEGQEELLLRFEAFEETMEEMLDTDVELFALSDRTVSSTALEYDQVDIVLSGPSEYILSKEAKPEIELAGGVHRADGHYHVVFIASEESGIESLDDAVGETIAMKDTGSTSGHIGPSGVLVDEGYDLDEDFDIQLLGDSSLEALLNGEVDVMADGVKHWHTIQEEGLEDEFRLIYEGEPLPADPFVLNDTLPEEFKEEFLNILMENEEEVLDAILSSEENDKYEDGGIIEVSDEDYDNMRETYEILGLEIEE